MTEKSLFELSERTRDELNTSLGWRGHPEELIGRKFQYVYQGRGYVSGSITGLQLEAGISFRLAVSLPWIEYLEFKDGFWYAKSRDSVLARPIALELF